jgi:hypothetical protein
MSLHSPQRAGVFRQKLTLRAETLLPAARPGKQNQKGPEDQISSQNSGNMRTRRKETEVPFERVWAVRSIAVLAIAL